MDLSYAFVVQQFPQQRSDRLSSTSLASKKNSDRALIERNLEDMMNNDWRLFRAKLVAQERAETTASAKKQDKSHSTSSSSPSSSAAAKKDDTASSSSEKSSKMTDEKLAKQGQLGEMFAGAISSIFKGNPNKNQHAAMRSSNNSNSIFQGDKVGGLALPEDFDFEDPFVSEAELPLLLKPKVSIDKHRWAHEIPHVERGCVLIANEKLGGVFHQTVVLITEHHEVSGSKGIVINRYVLLLGILIVSGGTHYTIFWTPCAHPSRFFFYHSFVGTGPWMVTCSRLLQSKSPTSTCL